MTVNENDNEITMEATTGLFEEVDKTTTAFFELLRSFSADEINKIPFPGSWTAAQVGDHVRKSNNGIAQSLQMHGRTGERKPDQRVDDLKKIFLNFNSKFNSPEFILPGQEIYDRQELLERLKRSIERLKQDRENVALSEIIDLVPLGTISKLELFHFVVYHTQRHLNQLKNIYQKLKKESNGTD